MHLKRMQKKQIYYGIRGVWNCIKCIEKCFKEIVGLRQTYCGMFRGRIKDKERVKSRWFKEEIERKMRGDKS